MNVVPRILHALHIYYIIRCFAMEYCLILQVIIVYALLLQCTLNMWYHSCLNDPILVNAYSVLSWKVLILFLGFVKKNTETVPIFSFVTHKLVLFSYVVVFTKNTQTALIFSVDTEKIYKQTNKQTDSVLSLPEKAVLQCYADVSGLCLHVDKTKAIWIGSLKGSIAVLCPD